MFATWLKRYRERKRLRTVWQALQYGDGVLDAMNRMSDDRKLPNQVVPVEGGTVTVRRVKTNWMPRWNR